MRLQEFNIDSEPKCVWLVEPAGWHHVRFQAKSGGILSLPCDNWIGQCPKL